MNFRFFLILTVLVVSVTGCRFNLTLEGNGDLVTEERLLSYFNEVNSGGNFRVNVIPGETNKVVIHAESNLLPYITTSVSGKELDIEVKGLHILDPSFPVVIDVETPLLKAACQSGSGELNAGNVTCKVDCETMEVNLSGSGQVVLEGNAAEGDFTISGSGSIAAYDFPVDVCKASISGSGCIYIHSLDILNASISGSGSVYYHGDPHVSYSISGSGRVTKGR
ncbi:MAG TPA: head GIN domain-containing protein [Prolixibacteraceae bacterium]|nr:head GIN domain-containing protein [Prolixibacteraceae bacterium]